MLQAHTAMPTGAPVIIYSDWMQRHLGDGSVPTASVSKRRQGEVQSFGAMSYIGVVTDQASEEKLVEVCVYTLIGATDQQRTKMAPLEHVRDRQPVFAVQISSVHRHNLHTGRRACIRLLATTTLPRSFS